MVNLLNSLRAWTASLILLAPLSLAYTNANSPWIDRTGQDRFVLGDDAVGIDSRDGFTMVIATYKRDQLLEPLLTHLTTSPPPSLRHIVLIWQNVEIPLPPFLSSASLDALSTSGVSVTVRQSKVNSMNERFRPLLDWEQEIPTDAIMIMDDDVVLTRSTLEWGYQEFKVHNLGAVDDGRIVGFTGRDFSKTKEGKWDYTVQPLSEYSMVLSNAAWFRKEWLKKYWEETEEMKTLRAYIDKVFNCDDLLINYLVSNLTRAPPLLLQPHTPLRTIPSKGLWNRDSEAVDSSTAEDSPSSPTGIESNSNDPTTFIASNHFEQRDYCLAYFFQHFSSFAPSPSSLSPAQAAAAEHYPLLRTSTSLSQDVVDHARWMADESEPWEEDPSGGAAWELDEEDEQEGLEEQTEEERREVEEMMANLSQEEMKDLMRQLAAISGDGDEQEEEEEDDKGPVVHEEL